MYYTAISIKVVPEQSGKVKRIAENRIKINELLAKNV
jgi:Tfp pilus assembly protein PilP